MAFISKPTTRPLIQLNETEGTLCQTITVCRRTYTSQQQQESMPVLSKNHTLKINSNFKIAISIFYLYTCKKH